MCSDKDRYMFRNRGRSDTKNDYDESSVIRNVECKVIETGTIKIKMFNEGVKILGSVRHVPKLRRNIISLGCLNYFGILAMDNIL